MAAGDTLQGRRIPVGLDGKLPILKEPGDYCGPITRYTGDKPAVFFLKPNARDPGAHPQHVVSPPHVFIEEVGWTLTIRESISDRRRGSDSDGWHGYLERGVWREV